MRRPPRESFHIHTGRSLGGLEKAVFEVGVEERLGLGLGERPLSSQGRSIHAGRRSHGVEEEVVGCSPPWRRGYGVEEKVIGHPPLWWRPKIRSGHWRWRLRAGPLISGRQPLRGFQCPRASLDTCIKVIDLGSSAAPWEILGLGLWSILAINALTKDPRNFSALDTHVRLLGMNKRSGEIAHGYVQIRLCH